MAESDDVAARALRYIDFAAWRHSNRKFGSGEFSIEVRTDPEPQDTLTQEYPEFSGKGNGSWTNLDVPSRIRRVGELAGRKAGSRLLAAYGLVYSISSEIIVGVNMPGSSLSIGLSCELLVDGFIAWIEKEAVGGAYRDVAVTLSLIAVTEFSVIRRRDNLESWSKIALNLNQLARDTGKDVFAQATRKEFEGRQWVSACDKWKALRSSSLSDQTIKSWSDRLLGD